MTISRLILDTNLLVLFVIGTASVEYISTHRRLRKYSVEDFYALRALLAAASRVIVTSHVLAETSNLLHCPNEPARTRIMETFRRLFDSLEEHNEPSKVVARRPEFIALGLADVGQLRAAEGDATLLTDDLDLYLAAHRTGQKAENFTYIRSTYL